MTRRIRQALADPLKTSEGLLSVAASVGIAVAEPGSDADDLLGRADKAMYRVKLARGRGGHRERETSPTHTVT